MARFKVKRCFSTYDEVWVDARDEVDAIEKSWLQDSDPDEIMGNLCPCDNGHTAEQEDSE